jgi:DNA mismatch repair protein MutH
VWDETVDIVKNGVQLSVVNGKVETNFPTSKVNQVVFTKIHASNIYYELEKDKFFGKGSLSDTDTLPDGRRITKHSFWFPKKFLKRIYDGNEDWMSYINKTN